MGSHSVVVMLGHLVRDPEMKHLDGGQDLCKFSLAINRRWRDRNGEQKEEVAYVDCEAWGKTGETICRYHAKGDPIYVTGRLKLDQWKDAKDGSPRSKLKVVVEFFQFIKDKDGGGGGGSAPASSEPATGQQHLPIDEADIPF